MALVLHANIDCEKCELTYEGTWHDDSHTVQDMAEPPVAEQECPGCGHRQQETYPGWMYRSEAG